MGLKNAEWLGPFQLNGPQLNEFAKAVRLQDSQGQQPATARQRDDGLKPSDDCLPSKRATIVEDGKCLLKAPPSHLNTILLDGFWMV